jgi:hypothetical protein
MIVYLQNVTPEDNVYDYLDQASTHTLRDILDNHMCNHHFSQMIQEILEERGECL